MNIGMNTGARMVHFAEAEPMKRLMKALKRMKRIISGMPPMPVDSMTCAPFRAMMVPRCV